MKYIAKTPINHNGKLYKESAEIELTDEQAEPLLAVQAIEPAPVAKKGTPEK